jgi:hypothetical protein
VFNWRIILGGAASAAILTAGVAAPAFAASSPVPLNGITQGLTGSQAGGIFCALPNLPVPVGVTAAAGAIGESCGSTQVNGSSQSVTSTPRQAGSRSASEGTSQGNALGSGPGDGQTNGPARTTSAPQSAGAANPLSGLGSLSGAIPNLGNAASVVPSLGNLTGTVTSGNSGLNSVSNAAGGVTGGLSAGQATSPLR